MVVEKNGVKTELKLNPMDPVQKGEPAHFNVTFQDSKTGQYIQGMDTSLSLYHEDDNITMFSNRTQLQDGKLDFDYAFPDTANFHLIFHASPNGQKSTLTAPLDGVFAFEVPPVQPNLSAQLRAGTLMLIVLILGFIWLGTPAWVLRLVMNNLVIRSVISFFTRPLIALFLFNMLFSIYHMPFIMDNLMKNDVWLFGYHTILLFTAFMMWFPVFSPLPEINRLNDLKKIGYIFGNGLLLTPACALIIFANSTLYDMYANVTVPFAHLSPMDDQQLGGVIMKIIQEIVYGATLAYIFFRWYRRERKEDEAMDLMEMHESLNNQGGNWNRA